VDGVVPIGWPFPDMKVLIVDEELREIAPGATGELLVSGPQRALGYWEDDENTAAAFRSVPDRSETWYRTGDLVRRPRGEGPLCYRGRRDDQIRVRGHRVELGEIEAVFRGLEEVNAAVAIGWPPTPGGADGIAVFVETSTADVDGLRRRAAEHLPAYMVPKVIRLVGEFPLSPNGKVDRRALARTL
jgi:acyl-CoA synthetase (AMP-forming)/AMP-acid ligase II